MTRDRSHTRVLEFPRRRARRLTGKPQWDGNSDPCARRLAGYTQDSPFCRRAQCDGRSDEDHERAETGVGDEPCQDQGLSTAKLAARSMLGYSKSGRSALAPQHRKGRAESRPAGPIQPFLTTSLDILGPVTNKNKIFDVGKWSQTDHKWSHEKTPNDFFPVNVKLARSCLKKSGPRAIFSPSSIFSGPQHVLKDEFKKQQRWRWSK